MKNNNSIKSVLLSIFLLFFLISCNGPLSSQPASSLATNTQPVISQPTDTQPVIIATPSILPTASSTKSPTGQTCNGWALHVYSVDKKVGGDGWTYLIGHLVFENVSATNGLPFHLYNLAPVPIMNTAEGFSYPMDYIGQEEKDTQGNNSAALASLPIGFRYTMVEDLFSVPRGFVMRFKVASSTTKHVVGTPCGILNFDQPENNFTYPTDLPSSSFTPLDTPINLPEGNISFTTGADCKSGQKCFEYTFLNANKGYDTSLILGFDIIGADGIVHKCIEEMGVIHIQAGPGQTTKGKVTFLTTNNQNLKLILGEPSGSTLETLRDLFFVVNIE